VQYTIYLTEKDVLEKIKEIKSINMTLPNKHYVGFNFSKFKKLIKNDEENVFVPLEKPSGCIYAKLDRKMNKL
jgi:urate oxidase